jgi:hypothetical protein
MRRLPDDGGPVFPFNYFDDGFQMVHPGASRRDWLAGHALMPVISLIGLPEGEPDNLWNEAIARQCYAIADAMIAESKKEVDRG